MCPRSSPGSQAVLQVSAAFQIKCASKREIKYLLFFFSVLRLSGAGPKGLGQVVLPRISKSLWEKGIRVAHLIQQKAAGDFRPWRKQPRVLREAAPGVWAPQVSGGRTEPAAPDNESSAPQRPQPWPRTSADSVK